MKICPFQIIWCRLWSVSRVVMLDVEQNIKWYSEKDSNSDTSKYRNIVSRGVSICISYSELAYRYKQYFALVRKKSITLEIGPFFVLILQLLCRMLSYNCKIPHYFMINETFFNTCCLNTMWHFALSRWLVWWIPGEPYLPKSSS